jgi:hypothetical protein
VKLESLSSSRVEARQQLPKFLDSSAQRTEVVGELAELPRKGDAGSGAGQ